MSFRLQSNLINIGLYGSVAVMLVFFYIPIFTLMAFSLQSGRFLTLPFDGISLKWYGELFQNANAGVAVWNSTFIALVAMVVSTIIGSMAAIVAMRYRFRGRQLFRGLSGAPLIFPQLLLGIILLMWFSVLGKWLDFNTGLVTAIIGHVVYLTPFVLVIVVKRQQFTLRVSELQHRIQR